jgi:hypothetical protein
MTTGSFATARSHAAASARGGGLSIRIGGGENDAEVVVPQFVEGHVSERGGENEG